MIYHFILIGVGYVLGAIPVGWFIARYAGVHDITRYGSGNIGATNVARIVGAQYFFIVLLLDIIKAVLYMQLLHCYHDEQLLYLGAAALLIGNGFSCFLQWKGGKGVATTVGILWSLNPFILYHLFFVWLTALLVTKKIGIASSVGLLALPCMALYSMPCNNKGMLFMVFVCLWGLWRHEKNIRQFFSYPVSS